MRMEVSFDCPILTNSNKSRLLTDIYDQVLEHLDLARYSKLSTIYSHFLLPTNSPHPLEDEREKTFHDSAAALNIVLKSGDMPECVLQTESG